MDRIPAPGALPQGPQLPTAKGDIARTAQEFEAVFLGEMSKLMLESVDMGDQFSGGHGEQMFRGMLAEKLGGEISRRGGIGIASNVMEQMIRMQGGSQ